MMDYKQAIIDNLMAMALLEKKNKNFFKARAYEKVLKQLKSYPNTITKMQDLDGIDGVGKSIKEKLQTIFEQGYLSAAKTTLANVETEKLIGEFTKIMAIGQVKARELVENHNIKTLDELRQHEDLLNDKQKLGLKYHDDFMKRIPRIEMTRHYEFLASVMPKDLKFEVTGSYRRGLPDSGDIDVLITSELPDDTAITQKFKSLVQSLKEKKYLKDDFAFGNEKYLGIARLPRFHTHRRIDIMVIPKDKFAFALLYFTGSQKFNIAMRNKALEQGYSLSEHGLKYMSTEKKGEFVQGDFNTESDVFAFLNMTFVEPKDRK